MQVHPKHEVLVLYLAVEVTAEGKRGRTLTLNALDDVDAMLAALRQAASWLDFELWCGERKILSRRSEVFWNQNS